MITRGAKFFLGAAALSYVCALVYGFITGAAQHGGVLAVFSDGSVVNSVVGPISFGWKGWVGDHVGYATFLGAAATFGALGGFAQAFRDGDAEAVAQVEHVSHVQAPLRPVGLSYWPLITAFGAGMVIIGLAVDPLFFVVGLVVLAVAGVSWTVRAWAERTSGDQEANREFRHQLMDPLEIPVVTALVALVVVLCVSRLLLALPKISATFVIIGLAVVVFVIALLLAQRPHMKRSVVVAVLLVGGAALLGAGIAGAIAGQREFEKHGAGESGAPAGDSAAVHAAVLNDLAGPRSGS